MDGNVTGQWMQHFVLRKLVLFTVLLTEEAYCLRKMKELRKQRLPHHQHHWSCDTGLTHRLYELKLLSLLDLLDEADILQRGPREVPLLHLQGGVSLKKGKHKQKQFKSFTRRLIQIQLYQKFSYIIMMTMKQTQPNSNFTHPLCYRFRFSSLFCVYGWLWVIIATRPLGCRGQQLTPGPGLHCHLPVASSVYSSHPVQ